MLPRFVLKPWEFAGFPHAPWADATVSCRWRGEPVTMRLKVRENLLFFAPERERDGRLFACCAPVDACEAAANAWKARPDALREKFARALASGDWGRCIFVRYPREDTFNPSLPLVFVLLRRDGRAYLRQLFDDKRARTWVNWDELARFDLRLDHFESWPHATLRRFLQREIAVEMAAVIFWQRRVASAADARRQFGPIWARGSASEMERWLILAAQIFSSSQLLSPSQGASGELGFSLTVHAGNAVYAPWVSENLSPRLRRASPLLRELLELLLRQQQVYAVASDHTANSSVWRRTRFAVAEVPTPSQHQRLEALLELRECVRGAAIEAAVNEILMRASKEIC